MSEHCVVWITGMPGAGKTTLSNTLLKTIKDQGVMKPHQAVLQLDGDQLREVFGNFNYNPEARLALAMQYSALANMLAKQGNIVIVSTVSLFHAVHQHNRNSIENYIEIFLNPSQSTLQQRNQKKLYDTERNDKQNLMGQGITPELPTNPHHEFTDNNTSLAVEKIISSHFAN